MSTTTTLVDYPDTQMLDYAPDGDFSMQNSPAEWLAVEATMLDDDPISAATEYSETIEVDMEPHDEHDGEITEYEMTDDVPADVDYDGDAQLLDVDVEVEHSPPSLQSVPDILIASEAGIVEQHPMTPPAHYALSSPALADVSVVMTESPSFHDVAVLTPLPETEARFSVTSPQHVHDESALAPVAELNSATPGTSHSPILPGDYPAAQAQSDTPAAATADASGDSAYQQTENVENPIANESVEYQAASVPAEPNAANEDQQPREQHDIQHEEHKAATSIASGADAEGDHSVAVENPDTLAPEAAEPTEEVPEEGDPHEISEGVYIDPPPAVLLSIASIATGDVCLFNHPPSKSRSQSPGESSTANSSTNLVLHEQPTLYYESLAQVFVALRQEQIVYSSAELVDNELILEAYDLNLTVGEDNVYAAQVTIHDLNEIHDRLGLTGPLRLRLTSGSRFITRYQALREQIAQIALGTDEQQPETEQLQVSAETAEEQPRSAVPSISDAHENESDEVNDAQDEVAQEVAAEEHHPAEGITIESQEDAQGEQVAQEYPDNGPPDGLVEQNQDSDRYENPENDDAVGDRGLELTVAPAVQELDADEVHRSADAEEGGDYATLETFPDDDDKFGEALPEELGGEAPANETEQLDEETSQEGSDEASTDPETAVKGSEDNNDEYDESEENIDPVVVRADEVLLAPENEDDADNATAHGSSENSEEAEQLYDYDDADGEHFTQENYEQEEWDELEDPDADQTLADDAASSKQSSETLSTLSKRSRDDDDDGYEEEDVVEGSAAGSPGSKRIRTH